MNTFQKSQLLAASAVAALVGGTAQAQVAYPTAELHAMGASSVAVVLPRELNCVGPAGTKNNVGKNDGTSAPITEGAYTGTDAPFDCATQAIQPNIGGKYISTGSGGGKTAWKNIDASTFFTGAAGAIFPSAFGTTWSNPHFVMSDSPLSASELSTFAAASATKKAGAAIQFPLYVLPVALAYNPVYGVKTNPDTTTTNLSFNIGQPVSVAGNVVGGLRLSKKVYCGIFNGYITNWNDPKITALNLKIVNKKAVAVSLKDDNDSQARWDADGVPIRLVGRLDKSGTTDIFTRHMAATCGASLDVGQANKYLNAAETLPYSAASGIDLTKERSDTNLKPSVSTASLAGTADMISGVIFDGTVIRSGRLPDGSAGSYTESLGKFIVADGSGKVAGAINLAADKASASDATVLLNGKIGYIGADFVRPAASQTLHAAALEQGTSNATKKPVFLLPTALNAQAAFGTKILPPQSDKGGKYVKTGTLLRSNAADWYNALYNGDSTLANAPVGYPITGTTQFVTGTCFADPKVRNALVAFLNASLGNLKFTAANAKLSADTFTGVKAAKQGIKASMGIAPLPKAWKVAITQTFLEKSKNKAADGSLLGDAALYIQAGLPTKGGLGKVNVDLNAVGATPLPTSNPYVLNGKSGKTEAAPNPNCTAGLGL